MKYIGIKKSRLGMQARIGFESKTTPTPQSHPEYGAVIGPFENEEDYQWALMNPHGYGHVDEIEELRKAA